MTRIKLYDFASSPNCQRVRVVLAEKRLPYDIIPIDLRKKEQKNPDFLRLNPYGKVPVIVDGDTVLYESCIINEYLDEKYPEPPLMPKDPALKAKIRILIDYGMNHLNTPYQKLREESAKEQKDWDPAKVEAARKEARSLLMRFEDEIDDHPFLGGDFSLLDADMIPRFLRFETLGVLPDPTLPRLGQWLQRMKERPSVGATG
jgi:glutathione S-transferase